MSDENRTTTWESERQQDPKKTNQKKNKPKNKTQTTKGSRRPMANQRSTRNEIGSSCVQKEKKTKPTHPHTHKKEQDGERTNETEKPKKKNLAAERKVVGQQQKKNENKKG